MCMRWPGAAAEDRHVCAVPFLKALEGELPLRSRRLAS